MRTARSGKDMAPSPFTADERAMLDQQLQADEPFARALNVASRLAMPVASRLAMPEAEPPPRVVFATPILPSMLGIGGHFDHAMMLELAIDACLMSGDVEQPAKMFEARVNYLGQAGVGETVEAVRCANGVVVLRGAATFESWSRAPLCIVEVKNV